MGRSLCLVLLGLSGLVLVHSWEGLSERERLPRVWSLSGWCQRSYWERLRGHGTYTPRGKYGSLGQAKYTDAPYPSGNGAAVSTYSCGGERRRTVAKEKHSEVVDIIWLLQGEDEMRLVAEVSRW